MSVRGGAVRAHSLWLILAYALLLPGCGHNPERQAERHLRLATRDYWLIGIPESGIPLRHLEEACRLSPNPRYRLALAIARYDSTHSALPYMASMPVGSAGEPDFHELLRRDPRCAAAHFYLGRILQFRQDPGAEACFLAAADADPDNALPIYVAAALRAERGDDSGALKLVQRGNVRKSCRFYVSAAQDFTVGGAGRIIITSEIFKFDSLREIARRLASISPSGVPVGQRPSIAARLLGQGREKDAWDACEASWQMGKKVSCTEPALFLNGLIGTGIRGIALSGQRVVAQALHDPKAQAMVASRQQLQAQLQQFLQNSLQHGSGRRMLVEFYYRRWALQIMATILSILVGGCAYFLRRIPRVALALGLVACVWLGLAVFVTTEGYMAPATWFPDMESKIMRQMVQMIP